jgi:hypothetical protein
MPSDPTSRDESSEPPEGEGEREDERERVPAPGDELPPSPLPPATLSYATRPPKLKTIRTLASFEANLAAVKLEAAGVPCFVIDDNVATAYPLVFASVKVQVPEDQVERAEVVLTQPYADAAGLDDHEDEDVLETSSVAEAESESEYAEEAYRCPKCHRKDVELLPLAGFMRNVRFGCFVVLLLPIVASIATWMMRSGSAGQSPDLFAPEAIFAWMAVLGILSFAVLTAKRRKHCRACGHEWQS